ncbi:MAG: hypothetical protein NT062_01055, partial [Proteobacteria bacterium]|nr:hypothetical protein [Pseudomonadota bacterium]
PSGNPTLAFDAHGELIVGHATEDAWVAGPVGGPPRWTVHGDPLDGSFTWGDGPAGHGRPTRFTIAGDRLVFVDDARAAIRVLGPTSLSTIVGGRAGRRDGPTAEAELFEPAALGIGADGGLRIVETSATSAILRAISP